MAANGWNWLGTKGIHSLPVAAKLAGHPNLSSVSQNRKFGASSFQRCMTVLCLTAILAFTSAEAVHVHGDRSISRDRAPCLVCFSIHATPSPATAHPVLALVRVASIVVPSGFRANGIVARLELFTRPPPNRTAFC